METTTLTPSQALSSGLVQTQANEIGAADPLHDEQVRQGVRVGGLGLMLRYEEGSELTEMPAVYQLPNAPDWLLGVANLHGALIPVFDLACRLGVTTDSAHPKMLLVLMHDANAAGIVIDGLPRRLRPGAGHPADTATAPEQLASHVRGAVLIEDQLWFDLDAASLLDAMEQAMRATH